MTFIGNINYVFVAVIGGLQVASGQLSLGDVQAFIQYSRQFSQPISQVASMANLLQSGVASAERVFALLDATEQEPDDADARPLPVVRGEVAFEDVVVLLLPRPAAHRGAVTRGRSRRRPWRSSGRRVPARRLSSIS